MENENENYDAVEKLFAKKKSQRLNQSSKSSAKKGKAIITDPKAEFCDGVIKEERRKAK